MAAYEFRKRHEIESCPQGAEVILFFHKGIEYRGIFRGMDGVNIVLLPERRTGVVVVLPYNVLDCWFLKIK